MRTLRERVSARFMSVNRDKESVAPDLKDESDRKIFEELIERADVVVEDFRSGAMEKLGYGCEALRRDIPH
jgi:CoA:oxalate CoA-transferase